MGGWSPAATTDPDVIRTVNFVLGLINVGRGKAGPHRVGEVLRAARQVVSGTNTSVTFTIDPDSGPRSVSAVVWEQPWLDHVELTSLTVE